MDSLKKEFSGLRLFKLHVCKGVLKICKESPSRFLKILIQVFLGSLRSCVGMLGASRGMGHRRVLNCSACKESVGHIIFEYTHTCISHDSQRQIFELLKQVLPLHTFGAFLHNSIFDKAVFCLREKQGMSVSDDCTCSSWYTRIGNF